LVYLWSDLGDTKDKGLVDIVQGNFYPLLVAYSNVSLGTEARYDARGETNELTMVGIANNGFANFVEAGYNKNTFLAGQGLTAALQEFAFLTAGGTRNAIGSATDEVWSFDPDTGNAIQEVVGMGQSLFQAGANNDRTRTLSFNEGKASNHWAIAIAGNHAFTDDISMNYGLGYLALVNPNYRVATGARVDQAGNAAGDQVFNYKYKEQDKDLGFEIDLGVTFQLLDNLTFHSTFGYMINGDAYKSLKGYKLIADGTNDGKGQIKAVWEDPKNTYIWANTLQFDF